jgi:hypothetical protein
LRRTLALLLSAVSLSAALAATAGLVAPTVAAADPLGPGYCVDVVPPWPDDNPPTATVCTPWD